MEPDDGNVPLLMKLVCAHVCSAVMIVLMITYFHKQGAP